MKIRKIAFLLAGMLLFAFASRAQQTYKSEMDNAGNKVLVGKLNLQLLANDSAFNWFYTGVNKYQPNKEWTKYIQYYRDSFSVVVFASTWDVNSKQLLPSFYRTMMGAGFPLNKIQLYGVDHDLHTLGDEAAKYNIKKLPTIIVLHQGEELGRIEAVPVQSVEANIVAILQKRFLPAQPDSSSVTE